MTPKVVYLILLLVLFLGLVFAAVIAATRGPKSLLRSLAEAWLFATFAPPQQPKDDSRRPE